MKIAVMMRPVSERGGIGVFTANLLEQMLRIGTEHSWLLLYPRAMDLGRFTRRAGVRELLVTARSKLLWDQVAVPLTCRRENVDVLFHPKFTVPLFAPCPTIMTLHGTGWFTSRFFGKLDVAYVRLALPWYLRKCTAVSSVSRITTEFFTERYQLPPGKIRTIYFGPAPNFERVHDAWELLRVRTKYRLPNRFVFYLTKYKDAARKNIRGALEAYRRASRHIDHDLVVGGTDCERFRKEYRIPRDGWGARVHFPGWMDQQDLPAVYSLATAFFYPSLMEAFPIPITEAMKCETPIITSDRNGLAEIAGDAALLVNPENPLQMAAALCRLLADEHLQEELRARSRARSALFSWNKCARETLDLITSAAGKGASAHEPATVVSGLMEKDA